MTRGVANTGGFLMRLTGLCRSAHAGVLCLLALCPAWGQQDPGDLFTSGTAAVEDVVRLTRLGAMETSGVLGERYTRNLEGRLLKIDENDLLDGFRHRPGKQDWIGEHVGKWLHASALVYAGTGNAELRSKMDRVVDALLATQEPDGYLGTYLAADRMGQRPPHAWDVWVHKYDMLGLLAYYQVTGRPEALEAARRIGNLLVDTFGPGKKDINRAGEHVGMAATSVLEPMVLLYRVTGDKRYLAFADTIAASWETTTGAHIVSVLNREGCVRRVGNAKAYEMLSNLCGLVELYRAEGNRSHIQAALRAWEDIVQHHLYVTGTGSADERWQEHGQVLWGAEDKVGEACVTVTWLQLNMQLYRLLGDSRYVNEAERTIYNRLLGAQHPSGEKACYYMPLEGAKPFQPTLTCCFSSLARGIALVPGMAHGARRLPDGEDAVDVNLLGSVSATVDLPSGGKVGIATQMDSPLADRARIVLTPQGSGRFALRIRPPNWLRGTGEWTVNGRSEHPHALSDGYLILRRDWKSGDQVDFRLWVERRLEAAASGTTGSVALLVGPAVLAADEADNPGLKPLSEITLVERSVEALERRPADGSGLPVYVTEALKGDTQVRLVLRPFFAAGAGGSVVQTRFPYGGVAKCPVVR
jgi:uncharacterized protein